MVNTAQNCPALTNRRHDIDALRVFAIGLLIFYHAIVAFLPFGPNFAMSSPSSLALSETARLGLLGIVAFLSVWRIPLLFVIAGMAADFSLRRRSLPEFLKERLLRIGLPLAFGIAVVFPATMLIWLWDTGRPLAYYPTPGHLWFLVNLLIYAFVLAALLWLGKNATVNWLKIPLAPALLTGVALLCMGAIVLVTQPEFYSGWGFGPHTMSFGLVCFTLGYGISRSGARFGDWTVRFMLRFALTAAVLLACRLVYEIRLMDGAPPYPRALYLFLAVTETLCWILACLGAFAKWGNKPSAGLIYATKIVFPVYIVHYAMQNIAAIAVRDSFSNHGLLFILMVALELAASLAFVELAGRSRLLRPLFGFARLKR